MESWENIEGFRDYKVSSEGKIKSLKYGRERILKQAKDNNGYLIVNLYENKKCNTFKVHKLVAKTFISNPNNKEDINHINRNKNR